MSTRSRSARSSPEPRTTGPTDARPAAEDEEVGAEHRELELRLLDREEVRDRLGQRPEAILGRDAQLVQLVLVLDERDAAVQVDLERLGRDVRRGDVRVDARVDAHRPRRAPRHALQLGDGLVQHLDVELEAERGDMAGLLGAEQVAGAADLEVAHRDREAGAELGVVGEGREPRARLGGQVGRVRDRRGRRGRARRCGRRARGSGRAGPGRAGRRARRSACSPAGCRGRTR